jgi:hypothetical protein
LAEEHLCTGNQSCSLYKTDKVALRHISAFVHDNDCMPGWLGPVFSVPEPAVLNTGLGRDWELHREQIGHMAGQEEGEGDKPDHWDEEG